MAVDDISSRTITSVSDVCTKSARYSTTRLGKSDNEAPSATSHKALAEKLNKRVMQLIKLEVSCEELAKAQVSPHTYKVVIEFEALQRTLMASTAPVDATKADNLNKDVGLALDTNDLASIAKEIQTASTQASGATEFERHGWSNAEVALDKLVSKVDLVEKKYLGALTQKQKSSLEAGMLRHLGQKAIPGKNQNSGHANKDIGLSAQWDKIYAYMADHKAATPNQSATQKVMAVDKNLEEQMLLYGSLKSTRKPYISSDPVLDKAQSQGNEIHRALEIFNAACLASTNGLISTKSDGNGSVAALRNEIMQLVKDAPEKGSQAALARAICDKVISFVGKNGSLIFSQWLQTKKTQQEMQAKNFAAHLIRVLQRYHLDIPQMQAVLLSIKNSLHTEGIPKKVALQASADLSHYRLVLLGKDDQKKAKLRLQRRDEINYFSFLPEENLSISTQDLAELTHRWRKEENILQNGRWCLHREDDWSNQDDKDRYNFRTPTA